MTPETQALVDRLLAIHRRGIKLFGEGMLADDLRNAQSAPDRVCERWVEEARGDARIGLDVLAIRDAAAALTALARDLAQTKEAAEVVYASSKANAEEVQRLARDLETARQERDATQDKLKLALATSDLTDAGLTHVIEAIAERMGRAMEAECRRQIEAAEASRDAAVRAARAETWAEAGAVAAEWDTFVADKIDLAARERQ